MKSSDVVLAVFSMVCELFNSHAVIQSESTILAILKNIELLNEDEHSVEVAISTLTSCLRSASKDDTRLKVVKVLFDEVNKGARYSSRIRSPTVSSPETKSGRWRLMTCWKGN